MIRFQSTCSPSGIKVIKKEDIKEEVFSAGSMEGDHLERT
jgi:hypothetical protein